MEIHHALDMKAFLDTLPSHFQWDLENDVNIKTVMSHLDNHLRDNPDNVPVPSKSLRGYLCMSSLHKAGERDPYEALKWFDKALDDTTSMKDKEGQIGDEIVVLTDKAHVLFLLGKYDDAALIISKLKELEDHKNKRKVKAYIYANQAFALSWIGPRGAERGIECFQKALNLLPNQESWLFGNARLYSRDMPTVYQEQGSSQEEILYNKVLQINETNTINLVYLALNAKGRQSDFEAEWHFDKALEYGADKVSVVQRVGQYYEWKNNLDKALQFYKRALDMEPESSFIHYHLGVVYKKMKQQKTAISYFDLAIEKSASPFFLAMRDKAYVFKEMGNIEKARSLFSALPDEVESHDKSNAHFAYAQFLDGLQFMKQGAGKIPKSVKRKDEDMAIKHYKLAVCSRPDCYSGQKAARNYSVKHLQIGWIYEQVGHIDSSCFYYEKAYEIKPSQISAFRLSNLFGKSGNNCKKQEYFNKFSGNEIEVIISCAKEYEDMNQIDEARKMYSKAAYDSSLNATKRLLEILKRLPEDRKFEERWFSDCAIVLHNIKNPESLLEHRLGGNTKTLKKNMRKIETILYDILCPELSVLGELYRQHIRLLSNCLTQIPTSRDLPNDVLTEIASLLHKCMCEFQLRHYKIDPRHNDCSFVCIKENDPLQVKQILFEYGWADFDTKFGKLFLFLIESQPGYNRHQNDWMTRLFRHISSDLSDMVEDVQLEDNISDLVDLAKESTVKAVKIVQQFYKYINSDEQERDSAFEIDD
ncbi:interferon-induced protein with tetratricopeptide repeats 5-like [Saccoglossus kowalevskii]